jgi:hypothetical protein
MQTRILSFLKIKLVYPTTRRIIYEAIFLGFYTLLFLLIFEPFGTFEYEHPYKPFQLGAYGLLVLVFYPPIKRSLLIFLARKHLFYSLALELILLGSTLLLITIIAFFYHGLFIKGNISFNHLPVFTIYGVAFWTLPASVIVYHRYRLPQNLESAPEAQASTVEITGMNREENLFFTRSDIYYLRSNGNYVMIYFQKAGMIKHEMVRNTLGQVGSRLPEPDFMPIHRSYIVNSRNFDTLVHEEGKHFLVNRKLDIRLPVSRNYIRSVENKLRDHR